jgi:hypothetical protein
MADAEMKTLLSLCLKNTHELERLTRETESYIRPCRDHSATIAKYDEKQAFVSSLKSDFRINLVVSRRHSSLRLDLDKMSPIFLDDMRVNQIHYGAYLKCTVIREPFFTSSVQCLVEDDNKQVEFLDLYNFAGGLIGLGTRLIIKEPNLCLKREGALKNEFSIRCDSPTDVVVLGNGLASFNE